MLTNREWIAFVAGNATMALIWTIILNLPRS